MRTGRHTVICYQDKALELKLRVNPVTEEPDDWAKCPSKNDLYISRKGNDRMLKT